MRIRIENVVASTSLGPELDLLTIAFQLDGAEYRSRPIPWPHLSDERPEDRDPPLPLRQTRLYRWEELESG